MNDELNKKEEYNTKLCLENKNKDRIINDLHIEIKLLKDRLENDDIHNYNVELQNKICDIACLAIEQKNEVITNMVKKYVKKQPRKHFGCSNVIYILTTQSLKQSRRYILGKAKNLTKRLSTYNKSDEHEVVFYQDCDDEDTMNSLEIIVFQKLKEFREQANRERFILPETKNIDFFINKIKECFEFLK